MEKFDTDVSDKLIKIDKSVYIFDDETISLINKLSEKIYENELEKYGEKSRTLDQIKDNTFQGYASQLCVGDELKEFGKVDKPSVQDTYQEWAAREKKHGDYKFFNGKKMQIKSMQSYQKDISMAFDTQTKYNDLIKTCDKNNPKYSDYILITRCVPLIKRKEYLVSASALLYTSDILGYVKNYGDVYHLQSAKLYCHKKIEWYDKYSPPCDENGNYRSSMKGVIIKRHVPEERPINLEEAFS